MPKTVGAAQFKADCLRLIDQMSKDGEPVTIAKHVVDTHVLIWALQDDRRLGADARLTSSLLARDARQSVADVSSQKNPA